MSSNVGAALLALSAALTELDSERLNAMPVAELARVTERVRRQLPALDHAIVAQFEERHAAHELSHFGARNTAGLLVRLLRISPSAARRRVAEAADLGPRLDTDGRSAAPLFPSLAAAVAAGDLDGEHVDAIRHTLDALPAELDLAPAEQQLVHLAVELDPQQLRRQALLLQDRLDPHHKRQSAADHDRRREVNLHRCADGSAEISGHLAPEAGIKWQTILSALSAPACAADGEPDPRTAGQRRHDALLDVANRLLSGTLSDCGATPVTLLITATADQLVERPVGRVRTEHGDLIDTELALRLAADSEVYLAGFDDVTGRLTLGRQKRLASAGQRRALAVRDGGCSFPDCDAPPSWSQAHHVVAWQHGGQTNIDNLTLLCGYHHREHQRLGWTCRVKDNATWWTPPRSQDEAQRPRRNDRQRWANFDFPAPSKAESATAAA